MSYLDGKNVPGSMSPYTVWLRGGAGVLGIDYRELNKYIYTYNTQGLYKYLSFWAWFSKELFDDYAHISGYSVIWNRKNINMRKVLDIEGEDDD